jgi:hypothetical protein
MTTVARSPSRPIAYVRMCEGPGISPVVTERPIQRTRPGASDSEQSPRFAGAAATGAGVMTASAPPSVA